MRRGAGVARALRILRALEAPGARVTIAGLARLHQVSPRTIRRDLAVLAASGYALCREDASGERLEPGEGIGTTKADTTLVWWVLCRDKESTHGRTP